jgi:hypothetical protein
MTKQKGFITMFNLTKHANKRLNQRGITGKTFKLFMQYADREVNVGSGDFALSVSNSQSLALKRAGVQSDVASKILRLVVVCTAEGVIKTCMIGNDKKGKYYTAERKRCRNDVKRACANDNQSFALYN